MRFEVNLGLATRSLRLRLRRPLHLVAFLAIYLPSVTRDLWSQLESGGPKGVHQWVPLFLTPSLYLFWMIWLAPMPWQVMARAKRSWTSVLVSLLFSEACMAGLVLLDGGVRRTGGAPLVNMAVLVDYLTFHAPFMAMAGAVQAFWERVQTENEVIREQAKADQARVLQGQLHPHVLFNALNGLAELVHKSSPQAETSIRHLSDLLRQVMQAVDQPEYSLSHERALLVNYLDMERLRLGDRLSLRWEWDPSLENQRIPPLILQGLLENALKHGVSPSLAGGEVIVQATREDGFLVLGVHNTGIPLGAGVPSRMGLGLANLHDRLALLYGEAGTFSLRSEGAWTRALIRLPLAS